MTIIQSDNFHAIASVTEHPPYLIRALRQLATQPHHQNDAEVLLHDLSGITAMVAEKFTNNRTSEGIQEALRLTVGCISIGLHQAPLQNSAELAINLLIEHGAERVFQQGFRHIRELAILPEISVLSPFDNSPQEQTRKLRNTFLKFCDTDPNEVHYQEKNLGREFENRKKIAASIECALWLRKHHYAGVIKDEDMDADGVIAIAVIFAAQGTGEIVAKAGQKKFEVFIEFINEHQPDFEIAWLSFIHQIPNKYQSIIQERINILRQSTLMKRIATVSLTKLTKTKRAALLKELQNHGGSEVDIDYP